MVRDLIRIKQEGATNGRQYRVPAKEIADYFGISEGAVLESREYSKTQQQKKKRYEKRGKPFITDRLDKLYAFHKIEEYLKEKE